MFFQYKRESERKTQKIATCSVPATFLFAAVTPHRPEEQLASRHHCLQQRQLLAVLVRTRGGQCADASKRFFDRTPKQRFVRGLRQVRKPVGMSL